MTPPVPAEDRAPRARAAGAAVIGVGLHPLALAAYEAIHLGSSPRLGGLAAVGVGLAMARHLAEVGDLGVHPLWWVFAHGALTAWWVVGTYRGGGSGPLVYPPAVLGALAAGGVLWLLRQLVP